MDIATKTVTTKVHSAVATPDILKGVAIQAVKNQLGLADSAVLSADASVGADGSVTVELVEAVDDASVADSAKSSAPPIVPSIVIPTGLGGAAPSA